MKKQSGFTLIELIVVIVILGVLASVAMMAFVDYRKEAAQASVDSIAGTLTSASTLNYSDKYLGKTAKKITSCSDAILLLQAPLDSDFHASSGTVPASGYTTPCTLTLDTGSSQPATATFYVYGVN